MKDIILSFILIDMKSIISLISFAMLQLRNFFENTVQNIKSLNSLILQIIRYLKKISNAERTISQIQIK